LAKIRSHGTGRKSSRNPGVERKEDVRRPFWL
jgi:hypothetical protein